MQAGGGVDPSTWPRAGRNLFRLVNMLGAAGPWSIF